MSLVVGLSLSIYPSGGCGVNYAIPPEVTSVGVLLRS